MNNQVVVREKNGRTFLRTTYNRGLIAVGASLPLLASAAEPLDMSEGTAQLALGLAAIGLLGAAKLAPSALSWVWGLVTRNAQK